MIGNKLYKKIDSYNETRLQKYKIDAYIAIENEAQRN